MIETRRETWGNTLRQFLKANNYNSRKALLGTGMVMAEQLQLEMNQFTDPGNAPSTIANKGFDKPLEDSKNLKRSVAAEVSGERVYGNAGSQ
ncbi:MAG: hypothetical protein ABFD89_09875 [Bryobacteraceae bacterium]